MFVRSKIAAAAAAAALTVAAGVGVGAAGTLTANAATSDCGNACIDWFSAAFGTTAHPGFVLDVPDQAGPTGAPVILARADGADPGEDFVADDFGTVNDFISAGLISHGMGALYGNLQAYEFEYAPKEAPSGECLALGGGTGSVAGLGSVSHVDLQLCGVNAATLWIADQKTTSAGSYSALISGETSRDFTHPQSLSVLTRGVQLFTAPLATGIPAVPLNHQLWGYVQGKLPIPKPSA
jgi:hypothetical protein